MKGGWAVRRVALHLALLQSEVQTKEISELDPRILGVVSSTNVKMS